MSPFSLFRFWHTYAHSHLSRGSKWTYKSPKKQSYVTKKTFFLRLYFCDKSHLYAKCLFDILIIYPKCHRFHFFSRDIRMYIPILTGVQNGHISCLKDSVVLLKNVLFEAFFPCGDHLYANCLFYVPTIYPKAIFFSFLVVAYVSTFPYYQGFKMGAKSPKKQSYFAKKRSFRGFISEMKVTCIPSFCLILFTIYIKCLLFKFLDCSMCCGHSHPN